MIFLTVGGDTVTGDTVAAQAIPQVVISYHDRSAIAQRMPDFYERAVPDVLLSLPFVPLARGFGRVSAGMNKGRAPYYTRVHLNGHELPVHPLGDVDLSMLPLPCMESVTIGQTAAGAALSAIGLGSRVNRYALPFSRFFFGLGSFQSNTYAFDLTRALTNELGFFMSGGYHRTDGHRANAAAEKLFLYSHVYMNYIQPMRFDVLYVNHDYGFPGSVARPLTGQEQDRRLDVSGTVGFDRGAVTFYYDHNSLDYTDTLNDRSLAVRVDHFGLQAERHDTVLATAFDYGARGSVSSLRGGHYLPTGLSRLDLWTRIDRSLGRTFAAASGRVEAANYHELFLCPRLEMGLRLAGSMRLSAALSRDARPPSDFERWAPYDSLVPYLAVRGDESLTAEHCWVEEFGMSGRGFLVNLYRVRFSDYIGIVQDLDDGIYTYANRPARAWHGLEGFVDLPLRLYSADRSAVTELKAVLGGNVRLGGDAVPFCPETSAGAAFVCRRDTRRFGVGIALGVEHGSSRTDHAGVEYAGYDVVSAAGFVRFLSLSCVARVNNVFDEEYAFVPYYPMEPRNVGVSVSWEFQD